MSKNTIVNSMHLLRRFVREFEGSDRPLMLPVADTHDLVAAIDRALRCLDQFWETAAGRKLTDEEKGLA